MRCGGPGRSRRARLRAVRGPGRRVADGDRRERPRRPRLEGVQRRGQATRRGPGRWPGQAGRQDLPPRSSRVGDDRGDPRRHEHPRDGGDRAGAAGSTGCRGGRGPGCRPRVVRPRHPGRRGDPGRRRTLIEGMRVLVAEPVAKEGVELLRAHHEVDERPGLSREELCAVVADYDALVVRSQVQVDAELIAAAPRLVVIGRAGVGVDNVDLEAATRAGIVVVNAPTGNTIAAAEHTLALLYGVARRTAAADASMRRGEWARSRFTGVELRGKTLGIVGLGKIGQAIAVRARAMEMTVLGVDPFISAEAAANHGAELVDLDELLGRSRSEERRVGKECRSRWAPEHEKKKKKEWDK